MSLSHLDKRIHPIAEQSKRERVAFTLAEKYIPYPVARLVIQETSDILDQGPSGRYKCQLLYAEPGNGKSTIMEEIDRLESGGGDRPMRSGRVPFVLVSLPETADLREFYTRILRVLGVPYSERDKTHSLHEQSRLALIDAGTRILATDELHNLLSRGSGTETRMIALRDFANIPVSLLCAGTDSAVNCILADEQLKKRFRCYRLDRWRVNADSRNFLATLESRLPLRNPSNLAGSKKHSLILRLSGGHLGTMVVGIREAARDAIRDGSECISEDGLRTAIGRVIAERAPH